MMAEGSVIVKQSVKTARYPRRILSATPQKIDLGRVSEASLISSAVDGLAVLLHFAAPNVEPYTYVQRSQSQA